MRRPGVVREAVPGRDVVEAGLGLPGGQLVHRGRALAPAARRRHAQRAAVHRHAHGLDDLEAVASEQPAERVERVEGQVLVVERVPLELLEQVAGVHHLEAQQPVRREHLGGRLDDRVGVVVVGEHVGAGDDVGGVEALAQLRHDLARERARDQVAALGAAHLRDVRRQVHADRAYAALGERRHQRAVVGAELDHGLRREALHQPLGVGVEVAHQPRDRPGLERVVLEQHVGVHGLRDLDQGAVLADAHDQRVAPLRGDRFRTGQKAAGERLLAEVEEGANGALGAGTADVGHGLRRARSG